MEAETQPWFTPSSVSRLSPPLIKRVNKERIVDTVFFFFLISRLNFIARVPPHVSANGAFTHGRFNRCF